MTGQPKLRPTAALTTWLGFSATTTPPRSGISSRRSSASGPTSGTGSRYERVTSCSTSAPTSASRPCSLRSNAAPAACTASSRWLPCSSSCGQNLAPFPACVPHAYGLGSSPGSAPITYYPKAASMSSLYPDPVADRALVRAALVNRGHGRRRKPTRGRRPPHGRDPHLRVADAGFSASRRSRSIVSTCSRSTSSGRSSTCCEASTISTGR